MNLGLGERMQAAFLTQLNSGDGAETQTQPLASNAMLFGNKQTHKYKQVCVASSEWYRVQYQQGIHGGYNGPGRLPGGTAQRLTMNGKDLKEQR